MTEHGYSLSDLRGDYIRAIIGFAVGFVPLALGAVPAVLGFVLMGLSVLFAVYGFLTYTRQRTRIGVDDQGIVLTAWRRIAIPWSDLQEMRLFYYATRRERVKKTGTGWMQLRLKGPDGTIRIESICEGFPDIVERAAGAAIANRLEFGGPTLANLEALNIPLTAAPRKRKPKPEAQPPSKPAPDDEGPLI